MTPIGPNACGGGGGADELVCAEVIRFLDDYVAGAVSAGRRAAFEAHLAICPECVEYIASYRRTIELARDSAGPPPAPASELPPELVRLILANRRR